MNALDYEPSTSSAAEFEAAQRSNRWSWWMLPMLLPSLVVAGLVGFALLASAGLEGSEPIAEQGAIGWLTFLLGNLVILPLPLYLGAWFALKARRLSNGALGTAALAVHGVLIGLIWVWALVSTLLAE